MPTRGRFHAPLVQHLSWARTRAVSKGGNGCACLWRSRSSHSERPARFVCREVAEFSNLPSIFPPARPFGFVLERVGDAPAVAGGHRQASAVPWATGNSAASDLIAAAGHHSPGGVGRAGGGRDEDGGPRSAAQFPIRGAGAAHARRDRREEGSALNPSWRTRPRFVAVWVRVETCRPCATCVWGGRFGSAGGAAQVPCGRWVASFWTLGLGHLWTRALARVSEPLSGVRKEFSALSFLLLRKEDDPGLVTMSSRNVCC